MTDQYYFIDENLKIGFRTNLEDHKINHANSILSVIPICPDIGIETRYFIKTKKWLLFTLD